MKPSNGLLAKHDFRRKVINHSMRVVLFLTTVVAIIPLVSVFIYVIRQGYPAINLDFLTQIPKPMGETGGGMANAIVGSALMIGTASLFGIPIGIAGGLYLSEYGSGKIALALRFAIDMLASIPSIVIGLFAYAVLVMPLKHFSGLAGAFALAVIMVPTVTRTTEELLKLVPGHIREAGLALGIPRWKVVLQIILKGSVGGITTGVMLAIARAAGETAPLLITALNSQYWSIKMNQPMASLPVQIYNYAISPYEDWHRQAWAGALVLVLFVFALNLSTRLIIKRQPMARD